MQRTPLSCAQRSTKWCAADPGSSFTSQKESWVPDQRCTVPLRFTLHRIRDRRGSFADRHRTIDLDPTPLDPALPRDRLDAARSRAVERRAIFRIDVAREPELFR